MFDFDINEDLLKRFRSNLVTFNIFDDITETKTVVPQHLEHTELLKKYKVSDAIYKYYTSNSRYWNCRPEFQLKKTEFRIKICGAYFYNNDLNCKLNEIIKNEEKRKLKCKVN